MDSIANFIISIRNAEMAKHSTVTVPSSKMKVAMAGILKDNGYVGSFTEEGQDLQITLRRSELPRVYKRVSKPGRRLYTDAQHIPMVQGGRGLVIISTSEGIMSGKDAKKKKLGGELICVVY